MLRPTRPYITKDYYIVPEQHAINLKCSWYIFSSLKLERLFGKNYIPDSMTTLARLCVHVWLVPSICSMVGKGLTNLGQNMGIPLMYFVDNKLN